MTQAAQLLGSTYEVPEEEGIDTEAVRRRDDYQALLRKLSHQSVVKHFDAYADIDWDSPEFKIDPSDARWELTEDDSLSATQWYRSQPQPIRARIGLHMDATFMRIGVHVSSVLTRGLPALT